MAGAALVRKVASAVMPKLAVLGDSHWDSRNKNTVSYQYLIHWYLKLPFLNQRIQFGRISFFINISTPITSKCKHLRVNSLNQRIYFEVSVVWGEILTLKYRELTVYTIIMFLK